MKAYLFNPENDIALAMEPGRRLNMSRPVETFHRAGALLPLWYAGEADRVIAECTPDELEFASALSERFGLGAKLARRADGFEGAPWGWSADAARQLRQAGAGVLSEEAVEQIRRLSHRRLTREVMSRLRGMVSFPLPPLPVECRSLDEVGAQLRRHGRIYVKQPWSGSGRGVMAIEALTPRTSAQISGMIARQGSVMTEKALCGLRDFAMLYHADGGRVNWAGYSLFFNSHANAYGGNLLLSDDKIEGRLIADGACRSQLVAVAESLATILSGLIGPHYNGWLGVDMLIDREGLLAPCIEVNLRMTMGVVAMLLRRRLGADYDGFTLIASRPDPLPAGSLLLTPSAITLVP